MVDGRDRLETLPPLEVVDEIGSTNAEMLARGRAGAPHGAAIRARRQTAGRGRRAHDWVSPEGGLYLSVLIRPRVASAQLPGLPVACALGVVDVLRAAGCPRARLKWPNDIVVGAAKLAGILTELAVGGGGPFAVCGVGVNMAAPCEDRTLAAAGPAALAPVGLTACLEEGCTPPSLDGLAAAVREGIVGSAGSWERGLAEAGEGAPFLAPVIDAYNERLAFRGGRVSVHGIDGPQVAEGILLGVDEQGRALVEDDAGRVLRLDASRASLRPEARLHR